MKIKKSYTKIALTLSIILMVLWGILGFGTSLAWFTDTTPVEKNIFHIGEMQLVVSHKVDDGSYEKIDGETSVFDDEALYEPGYVQVVYLKVENKGDIPFDYKTAVNVTDYTSAVNVFNVPFLLQDYLKFGVISADTEAELNELLANRTKAKEFSTEDIPLNTYETEKHTLDSGGERYMALIVRMPEEVGNIANYRGNTVPKVILGLIVNASQKGTLT